MASVDADIWVLTETHIDHAPTPDHPYRAFSPAHPTRRPEHERWVGIWSRWPLVEVTDPPAHRRGSLCVQVDTPWGPLLVYGNVIAWRDERTFDDGGPARAWEVHDVEAQRQADEWVQLVRDHPGVPLVVAGDFNQDRDGSGWYGSPRARTIVTDGLVSAGLTCVTEFDAVAEGRLRRQHLVDHVCVPEAWAARTTVGLSEAVDDQGRRLSDHPTVLVGVETSGMLSGTGPTLLR